MNEAELDRRFDYHAPDDEKRAAHQRIRDSVKVMVGLMLNDIPEGREQSLFLTNIEQAVFWANAAIARS